MTEYLVLVLVVMTSSAAYLIGAAAFGLSRAGLRAAVGRALESVRLSLVFLVANLFAGVLAVLALRVLTQESVSLYLLADEALPARTPIGTNLGNLRGDAQARVKTSASRA